MLKVHEETTRKYSWYQTKNTFLHVTKIKSAQEFFAAEVYARNKKLKIYLLGNGSNTFFQRRKISRFIVQNSLPQEYKYLGNDCFEVSSSMPMIKLLKILYSQERDGPYYLSSVPATIGGAVAMNAGTGRGKARYISEYLESVEYAHQGKLHRIEPKNMKISYRRTIFSENYQYFITKAVFHFPHRKFDIDPIKTRINWSREFQDLGHPNCGSVFRVFHSSAIKILRCFWGKGKAYWSQKTMNWICNKSKNPKHLRRLLFVSKLVHVVLRKKCDFEIRLVD